MRSAKVQHCATKMPLARHSRPPESVRLDRNIIGPAVDVAYAAERCRARRQRLRACVAERAPLRGREPSCGTRRLDRRGHRCRGRVGVGQERVPRVEAAQDGLAVRGGVGFQIASALRVDLLCAPLSRSLPEQLVSTR